MRAHIRSSCLLKARTGSSTREDCSKRCSMTSGRKASVADISRRFHNGLAEVLGEVACRLRERSGLERVCLSGGTFQNAYLFERLSDRLAKAGFQVFTHSEVPAGDGGLEPWDKRWSLREHCKRRLTKAGLPASRY